MKRIARIAKLHKEFRENAPDIATYFGMKDVEYTFDFTAPDIFHFKIIHEAPFPPCVFPTLPIEISIHIAQFLYCKKVVEYRIDYPPDYPFKPPKWTLLTILAPPPYLFATHILNYQYDRDWSPAISVEKDVLNMIGMIELCIEKNAA